MFKRDSIIKKYSNIDGTLGRRLQDKKFLGLWEEAWKRTQMLWDWKLTNRIKQNLPVKICLRVNEKLLKLIKNCFKAMLKFLNPTIGMKLMSFSAF
jgi:hypothetical protein